MSKLQISRKSKSNHPARTTDVNTTPSCSGSTPSSLPSRTAISVAAQFLIVYPVLLMADGQHYNRSLLSSDGCQWQSPWPDVLQDPLLSEEVPEEENQGGERRWDA